VEEVPLTLILPNGKEHSDPGKFVFIDRAVDTKTGTLRVRAEFPNTEKLLRPGMFARVRVDLGKRKDAIAVPQRAVTQLQGKNFVWVVAEDGVASQRLVEVGEQLGSDFLVTDGLKAGERIIVEGVHKAREGAPVTAMTAAANGRTGRCPGRQGKNPTRNNRSWPNSSSAGRSWRWSSPSSPSSSVLSRSHGCRFPSIRRSAPP
jgi:membrane fusion protein, multidrug efflux system